MNKKAIRYVMVALAFVFVASVALIGISIWDARHGVFSSRDVQLEKTIEYNGSSYVLKDGIETFLLIGLDKTSDYEISESYNNDSQADMLVLFVFDTREKTCKAIQINRDTMTEVNVLGIAGNKIDSIIEQIALSHNYGNGREVSCRNVANAVSKLLLNARVDHYLSMTMDCVGIINDAVGGVEVTVLDDFNGESGLVKGETVKLKADQALTYVRGRRNVGDGTNISRMERQRQYFDAVFQKLKNKIDEDRGFVLDVLEDINGKIVSDRSVTQLEELFNKISDYDFSFVDIMKGESTVGDEFMEFYPDENSVKELVIKCFYNPK
ncbi:MAG: LCP family protein [Clostridia bacterium]|nr:LCP family protein [Clostridia bacterium]